MLIHFKVDLRDSRDIHNFQVAQVAMVHYLPQKNHSHPWVVLGKTQMYPGSLSCAMEHFLHKCGGYLYSQLACQIEFLMEHHSWNPLKASKMFESPELPAVCEGMNVLVTQQSKICYISFCGRYLILNIT